MDSFELLYILNREMKTRISGDQENARFQKFSSSKTSVENELIKRYTSKIEIKMDWVEAIEKGLVFIEKAIKEERQFIRNDGEVEPIEKIRKVSPSSIRDLAKHSNYITHEAEPGGPTDVLPDKMLQVKKENDYAVYENRVLYAALVYLKNFVSSRLNKIREAATKFEADSLYVKKLDLGNQKLNFEFKMHAIKLNDKGIEEDSSILDVLKRLDNSMALIMAFLKTPLMNEVGKSDMVKRPITKTNVLRMNRNFRESLSLFDFVADYQGDGFTIEKQERIFNPFKKEITEDFANSLRNLYFLTYLHGSEREKHYEEIYNQYLIEKKKEEEERFLQKVRSFDSKAKMNGQTLGEYLIAFAEAFKVLEKKNEELYQKIDDLIETHKKEIESLKEEHLAHVQKLEEEFERERSEIIAKKEEEKEEALKALREEKDAYIDSISKAHQEEIEALEEKHRENIAQLEKEHDSILNELKELHKKEVDALNLRILDMENSHATEIEQLKENHSKAVDELNLQFDEQKATYEKEKAEYIEDKTTKIKELESNVASLEKELEELKYQKDLSDAKTIAYEVQLGKSEQYDEYKTADSFKRLEQEKKAFDKYFKEAWNRAKKSIKERVKAEPNEIEEKKKAKKNSKDEGDVNG